MNQGKTKIWEAEIRLMPFHFLGPMAQSAMVGNEVSQATGGADEAIDLLAEDALGVPNPGE